MNCLRCGTTNDLEEAIHIHFVLDRDNDAARLAVRLGFSHGPAWYPVDTKNSDKMCRQCFREMGAAIGKAAEECFFAKKVPA